MDPNANLDELRELVTNLIEHGDRDGTHFLADRRDDVMRVLELFTALDEWIVKGGFLPDRWQQRSALVDDTFAERVRHLQPDAQLPSVDQMRRDLAGGITVTTTPKERKEAAQALVYEKALKFVRKVAGSHYLPESMKTVDQWTANTIDEARVINREAEKAWT